MIFLEIEKNKQYVYMYVWHEYCWDLKFFHLHIYSIFLKKIEV